VRPVCSRALAAGPAWDGIRRGTGGTRAPRRHTGVRGNAYSSPVTASDHYGDRYFSWQRSVGEVGAILNQPKFAPWINPTDVILDFGCGGGALLDALPAGRKIGVEIGEPARGAAQARGLHVVSSLAEIPSSTIDVVISNHALEHVERPLDEVRELWRVLRPGGTAVLVVPINDWRSERAPRADDPNRHLYTWTPLLFANLLSAGGFTIDSCRVLTHAWRRSFLALSRRAPAVYRVAAWSLAVAARSRQIHAVARRPSVSASLLRRPEDLVP